MSRIGTLTFGGGISRLSGTRLMMGALDNDGFDRATNFLQQVRQLFNNEIISVDGTDQMFGQMPVILMTDANRVGFAIMAVPTSAAAKKSGGKKGGAKKAGTKKATGKKGGAKKGAAKKGGAKKAAGK